MTKILISIIIIVVLIIAIIIDRRLIKVHILGSNYQYIEDKLAVKVDNKVRLLDDLKLYDIIIKDNDIYVVRSNKSSNRDIYLIALILILLLGAILVNSIRLSQENIELQEQIIESNRILLDSLNKEVSQYILKVAPKSELSGIVLVSKCLEYDIDPAFVLAQAQLESHFGTQGLAKRTNSVWNVYAYDGLDYGRINSVGKYSDPNSSIDPYLKLITSRYLNDSSVEDLLINFINEDGNRYASDKNYENRLRAIHNEIVSNTNISKLYKSIIKGVAI